MKKIVIFPVCVLVISICASSAQRRTENNPRVIDEVGTRSRSSSVHENRAGHSNTHVQENRARHTDTRSTTRTIQPMNPCPSEAPMLNQRGRSRTEGRFGNMRDSITVTPNPLGLLRSTVPTLRTVLDRQEDRENPRSDMNNLPRSQRFGNVQTTPFTTASPSRGFGSNSLRVNQRNPTLRPTRFGNTQERSTLNPNRFGLSLTTLSTLQTSQERRDEFPRNNRNNMGNLRHNTQTTPSLVSDRDSSNTGRKECYRNTRNGLSADRQCLGYGGRCYITDEITDRGYCIQKRDCGNRRGVRNECPTGYRCDFNRRYCVPN